MRPAPSLGLAHTSLLPAGPFYEPETRGQGSGQDLATTRHISPGRPSLDSICFYSEALGSAELSSTTGGNCRHEPSQGRSHAASVALSWSRAEAAQVITKHDDFKPQPPPHQPLKVPSGCAFQLTPVGPLPVATLRAQTTRDFHSLNCALKSLPRDTMLTIRLCCESQLHRRRVSAWLERLPKFL